MKPRNLNMFTAGQDTPLFSGVCQTIKASAPAPAPDPWQQTSFTDQVSPEPISLTPWPGVQIPEQQPQVEQPQTLPAATLSQQLHAAQVLTDITDQIEQGFDAISQAMETADRAELERFYPELAEEFTALRRALAAIDKAGMSLLTTVTPF